MYHVASCGPKVKVTGDAPASALVPAHSGLVPGEVACHPWLRRNKKIRPRIWRPSRRQLGPVQDVPIPRGFHDLGKDMRVAQVIADQMPHLQPAPGAG